MCLVLCFKKTAGLFQPEKMGAYRQRCLKGVLYPFSVMSIFVYIMSASFLNQHLHNGAQCKIDEGPLK